jgi:hypothetical protein
VNPDDHLTFFRIKRPSGRLVRRSVTFDDQFGQDRTLRLLHPVFLAVPSHKLSVDGEEEAWENEGFATDHYVCYAVSGGGRLNADVTVADQFGSMEQLLVHPSMVCLSADKTVNFGEGPQTTNALSRFSMFSCYTPYRKGNINHLVVAENQFGVHELKVSGPSMLCIPNDVNRIVYAITASVGNVEKQYDGTTSAPPTTCTVNGVPQEAVVFCSAGPGTFNSPDAGQRTTTYTGITLSGPNAGDFYLASSTVNGTGTITPKLMAASVTAANKVYSGNTFASVSCSFPTAIPGDSISCTGNGAFTDPNVGTNKTVNVTNIVLAGPDAGNYALSSTTASATANITQASSAGLITVTGYNVTYDGLPHSSTASSNTIPQSSLTAGMVLTGTTHTNAGTYVNDTWSFTDPAGNYGPTSGTVTNVINKATPIVTFGPAPTPTNGSTFTVSATSTNTDPHTISYSRTTPATCSQVTGATFLALQQGTCTIVASVAATTNFNAASATQSVTISP